MGRHSSEPDACYEIIDGRIHRHRVIGPAGPGLHSAKCSRTGVADPYQLENAPIVDCLFCYPPLSSDAVDEWVRFTEPPCTSSVRRVSRRPAACCRATT